MKTALSKKIIYTILLFCLLGIFSASTYAQQSTVYFFIKSTGNMTTTMKLNGKEIFDMTGPVKKTIKPNGSLRFPYHQYSPCYRKCSFKNEGKMLFLAECKHINATNGKTTTMAGEIQLNLADGGTYYVSITNKGLNDVQLKELTEKDANKLLKNKKYIALPEYITQ